MGKSIQKVIINGALIILLSNISLAQRQMEALNRGVIAINRDSGNVYIGWRMLGTDPNSIGFNLYRSTNGAASVKLNSSPITTSTNYLNTGVDITKSNAYYVKPVINSVEQAASETYTLPANATVQQYKSIPLKPIPGGTWIFYMAWAGDLDGDGEYEIIVRRSTPNDVPVAGKHHASPATYKIEAYKQNGVFMWQIELGWNIEEGQYFSPLTVYDFDGDGKAEIILKTAEGTKFGDGTIIGDTNGDGKTDYRDPAKDYRVLSGPEFMSVVQGTTGKELVRTNYIARGDISDWGDNYGARVSINEMGVAYLDGTRPSLVVNRGIYNLVKIEAWDWRNGSLTKRWAWSSQGLGIGYEGKFQNWRMGDVDGDGKDEILCGSFTLEENGTPKYTTNLYHGDRFYLTDINPDRPGLEVYTAQQEDNYYKGNGFVLYDAETGSILWGPPSPVKGDMNRGLVADIDPRYKGLECWTTGGEVVQSCTGTVIRTSSILNKPRDCNFAIWWDGDLLRELLNRNYIDKYDYINDTYTTIMNFTDCTYDYRNAPPLIADLYGDWREEVVYCKSDGSEMRIYSTTNFTNTRIYTLMHDPIYRLSTTVKGYMQSTTTGFYLGDSMNTPPEPSIILK